MWEEQLWKESYQQHLHSNDGYSPHVVRHLLCFAFRRRPFALPLRRAAAVRLRLAVPLAGC